MAVEMRISRTARPVGEPRRHQSLDMQPRSPTTRGRPHDAGTAVFDVAESCSHSSLVGEHRCARHGLVGSCHQHTHRLRSGEDKIMGGSEPPCARLQRPAGDPSIQDQRELVLAHIAIEAMASGGPPGPLSRPSAVEEIGDLRRRVVKQVAPGRVGYSCDLEHRVRLMAHTVGS